MKISLLTNEKFHCVLAWSKSGYKSYGGVMIVSFFWNGASGLIYTFCEIMITRWIKIQLERSLDLSIWFLPALALAAIAFFILGMSDP